jgi:hypothetical protein
MMILGAYCKTVKIMCEYNFSINVNCQYCGNSYEIKCHQKDYDDWKEGAAYIQDILHYLSAADRELLLSSICDNCWTQMFGKEDEEV